MWPVNFCTFTVQVTNFPVGKCSESNCHNFVVWKQIYCCYYRYHLFTCDSLNFWYVTTSNNQSYHNQQQINRKKKLKPYSNISCTAGSIVTAVVSSGVASGSLPTVTTADSGGVTNSSGPTITTVNYRGVTSSSSSATQSWNGCQRERYAPPRYSDS